MYIQPFGVEMWMNEFETKCELNLAETCVESINIGELLALIGRNDRDLSAVLSLKMTYGAIEGSDRLRAAIAALYARQTLHNIVTTHGTIGANALVHQALVSAGDNVIVVVPTYQQHYSIPESLGANVKLLQLREDNRFLPDLDELQALAKGGVKLIAMTNPNNPTGALMDRVMLEQVVEIARNAGAWLLCDEVYRGIDQDGEGTTASIADLYEKGISTASTSKAFSLAGLRMGWIAAPREVIDAVMIHRDYNTISAGVLDDHFATLALENADKILARSRIITRTNLAILEEWVRREPMISWVKPKSGTTALLKYAHPIPSRDFCMALLVDTGVMFTPGSALNMEGHVRIGFGNNTDVLRQGLPRVSAFLKKLDQKRR
jgi:aspartate/methionine/tyrosine aminotransferase